MRTDSSSKSGSAHISIVLLCDYNACLQISVSCHDLQQLIQNFLCGPEIVVWQAGKAIRDEPECVSPFALSSTNFTKQYRISRNGQQCAELL